MNSFLTLTGECTTTEDSHPRADFAEEALRIIRRAHERGIVVRAMGATAIRLHCPKFIGLHNSLGRALTDLDVVGYGKQAGNLTKLILSAGYEQRMLQPFYRQENRQIYVDNFNKRVVDVFYDKVVMCHTINFRDRLEVDFPTIPLAELLLTKMQIFEFTEKDFKDTIVLLREHEIGENDKETINCKHIADILSNDWEFYYTVTTNFQNVEKLVAGLTSIGEEDRADVGAKIRKISDFIETRPKSLGWKMRAKIGTKKKWYREVSSFKSGTSGPGAIQDTPGQHSK
jgi:hypothetical protein